MNQEIVESFSQMVREKGIDKDILIGIVEDIFGMMVRKKYGLNAHCNVVVNMDKGDIEIYRMRDVVERVEDPVIQISKEEANALGGDELDVGEEFVEVIPLVTFGRRLIVTAKQNLNQRIKEIERENIYNEYSGLIGEIVVGEIYQIKKGRGDILVIHTKNELQMPRNEQIPKQRHKKGDTIRAIVKEVRRQNGQPVVIISRTDTRFLHRLFEIEIPEIYDGIIQIKAIAREPGDRAKVAVISLDDRIDAVGACVGMKGVRIHSIVRELSNENIDVINFSDDPTTFITRALSPAKLKSIVINEETKSAVVLVEKEQAASAIGKGGQNIRLASRLTGYEIQIEREGGDEPEVDEGEYDMELSEFREELGDTLYYKLFDDGYQTARKILETPKEELMAAIGLEQSKVDEIYEMLGKGLEDAEVEDSEEAGVEPETVEDESKNETSSEPVKDENPAETDPAPEDQGTSDKQ